MWTTVAICIVDGDVELAGRCQARLAGGVCEVRSGSIQFDRAVTVSRTVTHGRIPFVWPPDTARQLVGLAGWWEMSPRLAEAVGLAMAGPEPSRSVRMVVEGSPATETLAGVPETIEAGMRLAALHRLDFSEDAGDTVFRVGSGGWMKATAANIRTAIAAGSRSGAVTR